MTEIIKLIQALTDRVAELEAALTDRVAELEATACKCQHCRDAKQSRQAERDVAKIAALEAMPADERNATIRALTVEEQYRMLPLVQDKVRLMLEAPADLRDEIKSALKLTLYERDQIRVRQMDLPARVTVTYASERYRYAKGPIQERAISVDEDEAVRLLEAKLPVKEYASGHVYTRPALIAAWPAMLATTFDLMLEVDDELAAAIAEGTVIATPLTLDQLRAYQINQWNEERSRSRFRSHDRTAVYRS